ncbi:MAG TPA: hypothetical protein VFO89_06435, partial [Thermoanaerobaculia bacterium]|nr:hypothetical protein [Thermoanaerobaculia bacterium]
EFKARLMAIVRKGEETIKLILADPIGFLGNLINAIKGGISAFVGNIWSHLKRGFMKWLFGNLPPGVEIPSDLSLVSIFKMVMGVLGITYDRMRAKAVKLLGERNVRIIEKLVEYVRALITGGPAALWEKVKEDLSSLKAMVIDAIQDWIVTTIVKNAVAKIVSMFNPAGAIIQAIMAIYNVVMFVVERAAQIMELVESVINSIHAIATGSIGAAVKKVETALGNAVPILIGFLARLIGLGGISQKIRDFIMKVQAKVDAAIDKAIKKIVDLFKKTIGKLFGKDKPKSPEEAQKKLDDAMGAAVAAVARFAGKAVGRPVLRPLLAVIRVRYGLKSLEAVPDGTKWAVVGEINPRSKKPTPALSGQDIEVLLHEAIDKLKQKFVGDPEAEIGMCHAHAKTLADFARTSRRLPATVLQIRALTPLGLQTRITLQDIHFPHLAGDVWRYHQVVEIYGYVFDVQAPTQSGKSRAAYLSAMLPGQRLNVHYSVRALQQKEEGLPPAGLAP